MCAPETINFETQKLKRLAENNWKFFLDSPFDEEIVFLLKKNFDYEIGSFSRIKVD